MGLYLDHGVLVGLAMASTFIPLTVVVSSSFDRHRSLALGVAVSGIGLGTLVMAPLIAYLIRTLGWREAYLVLAPGCGAVLLVGTFLVGRPRLPAHHAQGPPLSDALRSRPTGCSTPSGQPAWWVSSVRQAWSDASPLGPLMTCLSSSAMGTCRPAGAGQVRPSRR